MEDKKEEPVGIPADPLPDDIDEGEPDETTRWDHSDTKPGVG